MLTGRIAQLAARIGSEFRKFNGNIGDLSALNTPNKESIVSAINSISGVTLPVGSGQQGQILTLGETGAGWTNQGNYQNVISIATSTQLDESHLGCVIDTAALAGIILTLPASNDASKGKKITFSTRGAGIVVNPAGSDTLVLGNFRAINTLPIPIYSSVTVVSLGGGLWKTISEMPSGIYRDDFGYRVNPDGLIEQWGIIAPNVKQVTFHLPFSKVIGGNISWANANPSSYYSHWLGYTSLTETGFVPGGNINENLPYSRFYSFIGE